MKTLKVEVPNEFVTVLGGEDAARQEVTRLAVVELVRKHVIGRGQGAELLKMGRLDLTLIDKRW